MRKWAICFLILVSNIAAATQTKLCSSLARPVLISKYAASPQSCGDSCWAAATAFQLQYWIQKKRGVKLELEIDDRAIVQNRNLLKNSVYIDALSGRLSVEDRWMSQPSDVGGFPYHAFYTVLQRGIYFKPVQVSGKEFVPRGLAHPFQPYFQSMVNTWSAAFRSAGTAVSLSRDRMRSDAIQARSELLNSLDQADREMLVNSEGLENLRRYLPELLERKFRYEIHYFPRTPETGPVTAPPLLYGFPILEGVYWVSHPDRKGVANVLIESLNAGALPVVVGSFPWAGLHATSIVGYKPKRGSIGVTFQASDTLKQGKVRLSEVDLGTISQVAVLYID